MDGGVFGAKVSKGCWGAFGSGCIFFFKHETPARPGDSQSYGSGEEGEGGGGALDSEFHLLLHSIANPNHHCTFWRAFPAVMIVANGQSISIGVYR